MKVIDRYDFDENMKERYIGTNFMIGKEEYLGKAILILTYIVEMK